MYWLGIDIGTGGSRALLINARGELIAGYRRANPKGPLSQLLVRPQAIRRLGW